MLTPLLAKLPGSVFFGALKDGEPAAFVMLAVVVALFACVYLAQHWKVAAKQKS